MRKTKKRRIFFRVFPFNRLSYPVLLKAWECSKIDREFDIKIIDRDDIFKKIDFKKDDVLLYSFMTPFLPLIHNEIAAIKSSGALIVAGGPHVSGEQDLAFAAGFDILFVGAGEDSFLRFGRDLLDNNIEKEKYHSRPGRENSNLNDYLPISKYLKTIPPIEIMRGCFRKCKYCGTGLQDVHFRSLNSIRSYLDEMKQKKLKRVNFISPSALEYEAKKGKPAPVEKIEKLLQLVQSYEFKFLEYGIFPSEIRPDTLSDESMKVLKKYVSNRAITIGAQSSLDSRLKELGREHNTADIIKAVEIAKANDFTVNLDFILGFPDETTEERALTIEFIKKITGRYRVKTQLHFFFPLPGSGYGYRFPSFLTLSEKENLLKLKKDGICRAGWIDNEKQVIRYFNWLERHFPGYYSRYH
ncbi:MAG: TIGR04013 family B12-binding domain/radical SAM domain-containing protein [Candidatus Aminicenantes bacterium]|nr:TIGR04013 family B12-binding domain/radical SAM domain-containing protein [Candidatus Aminicenantes bacterium]